MRILSGEVKIHQILVIFETANQFLQSLHRSSVSWDITSLYFLAEILHKFYTKFLYLFGEIPCEQSKGWNCTLMGSFCPNHIKFQPVKYRRIISHDTEEWWKVFKKTDLWFQIWHEKFGEFSPNHSKVWKFYFDGLFLSEVCKIWAKKMQRNYLSWYWAVK